MMIGCLIRMIYIVNITIYRVLENHKMYKERDNNFVKIVLIRHIF